MRMTNYLKISILILTFITTNTYGQDILLEEDVNADTTESVKGPNKKKFSHVYYGLAFAAGPDSAGSRINYGKSFEFIIGRRVKWRINNFYALGMDFAYHLNSYSLKQGEGKLLPNDSIHDKERLKLHNLSLGFYNRINFNKRRGNHIGNYLDFGVRLDVPFAKSIVTEDELKLAGYNNGRKIKTKTRDLRFIEDYYYSGYIRIGFNKYALTASYRLANIFISDVNLYSKYNNGLLKYPELPLLNVGVEIAMY